MEWEEQEQRNNEQLDNYGYVSGSSSSAATKVQRAGQIGSTYVSSTVAGQDNFYYQGYRNFTRTLAVANVVTGNYAQAQAQAAYQNIQNQIGTNSAQSDYLASVGIQPAAPAEISLKVTNADTSSTQKMAIDQFSSQQLATLQGQGSITIGGVTYSMTEQTGSQIQNYYQNQVTNLHQMNATSTHEMNTAMREMYHKGVNSFQHSADLVDVYHAAAKGPDALQAQIANTQTKLDQEINKLSAGRYRYTNLLNNQQLEDLTRTISADSKLSSAQKRHLIEKINAKHELTGFSETGLLTGVQANKQQEQRRYGGRIITSSLLGNDMQRGLDVYRGVIASRYAVTTAQTLAQKQAYSAAQKAASRVQTVANMVARTGMRSANKVASAAENISENLMQKQNLLAEKRQAIKTGQKSAFMQKQEMRRYGAKQRKLDQKITKSQTKKTAAKNNKNSKLQQKYENQLKKYQSKKEYLVKKQEKRLRKWKRENKLRQKAQNIKNALIQPFKKAASPFGAIVNQLNTVQAKFIKYFVTAPLGAFVNMMKDCVLLCVVLCLPLLAITCVSGALENADVSVATVSNQTENLEKLYSVLKYSGFDDNMIAGLFGCWQCESGVRSDRYEGDYALKGYASSIVVSDEAMDNFCVNHLFPASPASVPPAYLDGKYHYCGLGLAQWTAARAHRLIRFANYDPASLYSIDTQIRFALTPIANGGDSNQIWSFRSEKPVDVATGTKIAFNRYEGCTRTDWLLVRSTYALQYSKEFSNYVVDEEYAKTIIETCRPSESSTIAAAWEKYKQQNDVKIGKVADVVAAKESKGGDKD